MSKKERVCVTGAEGFLGSWLVKLLLSRGYIVHATVKDTIGDENNVHLQKLDNSGGAFLKLFKADLLDSDESFCAAIAGCTGVFHLACPVPLPPFIPHTKEALMEPTVSGTLNVLKACSRVATVKKVINVSTIGAVAVNPNWPKDQVMNEDCWSDFDFCMANEEWHCLAKAKAEKEAFEYAKRNGLCVVSVCPGQNFGPMLQPKMNSSSLYLVKFLRDGLEKADNGRRAIVDVRDTVEALLLVYEKPEAEGRYICVSHHVRTMDLVEKLKAMYPRYNYPKGFNEVETSVNILSSAKLVNLGWKYRPFEETIVDTIKNHQDSGRLIKT